MRIILVEEWVYTYGMNEELTLKKTYAFKRYMDARKKERKIYKKTNTTNEQVLIILKRVRVE